MCCIMKYGLFITNLVFSLAGLALIGLGIAVIVQMSDLLELIPVNINAIPISLIVIGGFIFSTAFFGCCGAIRENRLFLSMYAIIIFLLAAGKTYVAVVVFKALDNIHETVVDWLGTAFNNSDLREPFHLMETAMLRHHRQRLVRRCPAAAAATCCADPVNDTCAEASAYDGCNDLVGSFFETFAAAIGSVVVVVIAVEVVLAAFTICFCMSIRSKRR